MSGGVWGMLGGMSGVLVCEVCKGMPRGMSRGVGVCKVCVCVLRGRRGVCQECWCVYGCVGRYVRRCGHVHVHTIACVHIYTCTYFYLSDLPIQFAGHYKPTQVFSHVHTLTQTHTHMHAHTHTCTHACMHTCTHTCT